MCTLVPDASAPIRSSVRSDLRVNNYAAEKRRFYFMLTDFPQVKQDCVPSPPSLREVAAGRRECPAFVGNGRLYQRHPLSRFAPAPPSGEPRGAAIIGGQIYLYDIVGR